MIDHLQIDFEDGFSVITGETGSGKSILLGALGLIIGDRADFSSVRNKEEKCIVEGSFIVGKEEYVQFFKKHNLDFESETIIRREINTSGKSRAFINDTPVSLQQLKEIGNSLIDIHSQHETLLINDQQFIVDLLDSQFNDNSNIQNYKTLFSEYVLEKMDLQEMIRKETEAQNQRDYISFLINEFEEYDLEKLLANDLQNEYNILSNAEDIKRKMSIVIGLLNENGSNDILSNLKQIYSELTSLNEVGPQFSELASRVESTLIELEDISSECDNISDTTDLDEKRLLQLEEQISFINRLMHKHQLSDTEELLQKYQSLKEEVKGINNISEGINKLKNSINKKEAKLENSAEKISEGRKKVATQLQTDAKRLLEEMNMKHAAIEFRFEKIENFNKNGLDNIQLYVKTNLGGEFELLKKVASGGETSRIMLAIKSLQTKSRSLPTIIFDEIDTGVSGEIANKMGRLMLALGKKMQVMSITHLPQVAAQGKHHFKVSKKEADQKTSTTITKLNYDERQNEIAMLLSGSDITAAALKNAEELLKS